MVLMRKRGYKINVFLSDEEKQRTTRQAQYKQHVQDQQTSARVKNKKHIKTKKR